MMLSNRKELIPFIHRHLPRSDYDESQSMRRDLAVFNLSALLANIISEVNFMLNPHNVVAKIAPTAILQKAGQYGKYDAFDNFVRNHQQASWEFSTVGIEFKNMSVFAESSE